MQTPFSYRPPAPFPPATLTSSGGDLLGVMSQGFYRRPFVRLPGRGRDILIVNDPQHFKLVLSLSLDAFPKSDLMIAALEPLVGNGLLISNGAAWQRQRRMLEPVFEQMRVRRVYALMTEAVGDFVARMRALPAGSEIVLDTEMSRLALDVIFRAIFSRPIGAEESLVLADAFAEYQEKAPQEALSVLLGRGGGPAGVSFAALRAIGGRIRDWIAGMIDARLHSRTAQRCAGDLLQAMIEARDPADGSAFSRAELISQITVLFLAGHETSASALTWCFFVLSQQPALAESIRSAADAMAAGRPLKADELGRLALAREVFREVLRLYPPAAFITRVAQRAATLGGYDVDPGSFIVVSPWLVHRHHAYWRDPDIFDPARFSPARERELVPGTFLPFGLGARVCTGRALAMVEGPLVIAEVVRALRLVPVAPAEVTASWQLTVRPRLPLRCRVEAVQTPVPALAEARSRRPRRLAAQGSG